MLNKVKGILESPDKILALSKENKRLEKRIEVLEYMLSNSVVSIQNRVTALTQLSASIANMNGLEEKAITNYSNNNTSKNEDLVATVEDSLPGKMILESLGYGVGEDLGVVLVNKKDKSFKKFKAEYDTITMSKGSSAETSSSSPVSTGKSKHRLKAIKIEGDSIEDMMKKFEESMRKELEGDGGDE